MQGGVDRRAIHAADPRKWLARCGLLIVMAMAAGCTTDGTTTGSVMSASQGGAVAFESIDGPPPDVFHTYVQALNSEADARNVPVVSREAPAAYRVRSYLSAQVQKGSKSATIAWAWDVYDATQQRMLRLTGEETAGAPGKNVWNAADAQVMQRIARAGMEKLGTFVGSPGVRTAPPEPAAAPAPAAPAEPSDGDPVATAELAPDAVPLPRDRPPTALAFAASHSDN